MKSLHNDIEAEVNGIPRELEEALRHKLPDGNENLHDVDTKILNYLSTGVMVIATENNLVGWFYDKRESKKPIVEKMVFEVISE